MTINRFVAGTSAWGLLEHLPTALLLLVLLLPFITADGVTRDLSLLLVVLAAFAFQRFRNTLNG